MADEGTGYERLAERGVLVVEGEDRVAFLQGLVSNDVRRLGPGLALYACLLTAQGRFLHDFILIEHGAAILIDAERARLPDLMRRLKLYKLRSRVTLTDASEGLAVAAILGPGAAERLGLAGAPPGAALGRPGGVVLVDPRLPELGLRALLPAERLEAELEAAGLAPLPAGAWERRRLELAVPDGSRDLTVEKAILLENNIDALNGISWDKGCYVGQELTARTRYRGLIKKRLMPVRVEGALPEPGTPVLSAGREVGELRSGQGARALAVLRLDAARTALESGEALEAGPARLTPALPPYAGVSLVPSEEP